MSDDGHIGGHAVVIGGSIAGLLAARVLSERFGRVTVLDRDELPQAPVTRRAVPHGGHAHALLIRGKDQLEELFPGLGRELVAGGAVPFDPGDDLLFHQMGALRTRFRSGMQGISLTRACLELAVRRRVSALPGVEIRDRTNVRALAGTARRVTGVELDDGTAIDADLVVNASGRGGAGADAWLEKLGCATPDAEVVKIDVGYTTRIFHRAPGETLTSDGGLLHLMAAVPPHDKRAAAVFAVEGDRWMVTLGGWHRAHAPVDPAGFEDFAAALPCRIAADVIRRAEPVDTGDARRFTYPAARRRYFEKLRDVPHGFVALGDAICSFNPLYGQGMTVATLEAVELGRALDRVGEASPAMARRYYRAAGKIIETPWQMATGGDFMYPETAGPKPFAADLLNAYVKRAFLASHVSVPVHRVLMNMQHLLSPPAAIMRPDILVRSLLAAGRSPALRGEPAGREHRTGVPARR
ncbi:FAD-dependent oxidoreductase [Streptomyces sp. NPDC053367]|uniref:FAD-dependent oxidoreductase n=1 Tax=Streptomyces sp. NPDC053367 TaxID=3365700 RepID=UPI0037CEAF59